MCRKNNTILLIFALIITFSLMLALAPTSDFDSDGNFDSLITEGLLLLSLISPIIVLSAWQDQFPTAGIMRPRVLALTFRHPPILT